MEDWINMGLKYFKANELSKDRAYEDIMRGVEKTNYMAHKETSGDKAIRFVKGVLNQAVDNAKYNLTHGLNAEQSQKLKTNI
jgi:ribosomal protein L22